MIIKKLYRYEREGGGVSVSPYMPTGKPYTYLIRLVADEGKVLTDGTTVTPCVDVEKIDGWVEIEAEETSVVEE